MSDTGKHITDYLILSEEEPDTLSKKVTAAIHDGWQPYRSLTVQAPGEGYDPVYAQAMVKYADRF